MDTDLNLEKAKKSIRQREAVHEQQAILQSGMKQEPSSVDAMKYKSISNGGTNLRPNQILNTDISPPAHTTEE